MIYILLKCGVFMINTNDILSAIQMIDRQHPVKIGEDIETEFGVPIVNKRISFCPSSPLTTTKNRRSSTDMYPKYRMPGVWGTYH